MDPVTHVPETPPTAEKFVTEYLAAFRVFIETMTALREMASTLAHATRVVDKDRAAPMLRMIEDRAVRNCAPERVQGLVQEFARQLAATASFEADEKTRHFQISFNVPERSTNSAYWTACDLALECLADVTEEDLREAVSASVFAKPAAVRQTDLLLRGQLVAAVAAFDALYAATLRFYFRLHPGAIDAKDRSFTLAELREFGSLEDVENRALAQRVDELLREGLERRIAWIRDKDRLGIDLAKLVHDWAGFLESFERRHCVVHYGGIASAQYVLKTGRVSEGDHLQISEEYLEQALDRITSCGVILWSHAFLKLQKGAIAKSTAGEFLQTSGYELLRQERWKPARDVFAAQVAVAESSELVTIAKVNLWIADKHELGLESIEAQVRAWDVSALSPKFQMAQAALLDRDDLTATLVERCLQIGDLQVHNVHEWPLFNSFRGTVVGAALLVDLRVKHGPCAEKGCPFSEEASNPASLTSQMSGPPEGGSSAF